MADKKAVSKVALLGGEDKRAVLSLLRYPSSTNSEQYHIYLPSGGSPQDISVLLASVGAEKAHLSRVSLGHVATQILRARPDAVLTVQPTSYLGTCDFAYSVTPASSLLNLYSGQQMGQFVGRTVSGARLSAITNGGTWDEFLAWASSHLDLGALVGRSIRFLYASDSTPAGEHRAVKVETVEGNLIKGIDLMKMQPRNYRVDRIKGDIMVC